jgi:hypothetical protein
MATDALYRISGVGLIEIKDTGMSVDRKGNNSFFIDGLPKAVIASSVLGPVTEKEAVRELVRRDHRAGWVNGNT